MPILPAAVKKGRKKGIIMENNKTFTQDEVDKIIKEKSELSFKAGMTKAQETNELKELREFKQKTEYTNNLNQTKQIFKDLNVSFKKGADNEFLDKYKDDLIGKDKDTIKQFITKKKEQNAFYFNEETETNASNSLLGSDEAEQEELYYPGSTIKRR